MNKQQFTGFTLAVLVLPLSLGACATKSSLARVESAAYAARNTADQALQTANSAQTNASEALSRANTAQATANEASSKATAAQASISDLQSKTVATNTPGPNMAPSQPASSPSSVATTSDRMFSKSMRK